MAAADRPLLGRSGTMDIADWVEGASATHTTPLLPMANNPEEEDLERDGSHHHHQNDREADDETEAPEEEPRRPIWRDVLFALPLALDGFASFLTGPYEQQVYAKEAKVPTDITSLSSLINGIGGTILVLILAFYADNLRTRFGRRKPLVAVAATLVCASTYLLLFPLVRIAPDNSRTVGIYKMWIDLFSDLAGDVLTLAYTTWSLEITRGGAARVQFFAIKTAFPLAVHIINPSMVVAGHFSVTDLVTKLKWLRHISPGLVLAAYLLVCVVERERDHPAGESGGNRREEVSTEDTQQQPKKTRMGFLPEVRCCLRNRPWLIYLAMSIALDLKNLSSSAGGTGGYMLQFIYRIPFQEIVYFGSTVTLAKMVTAVLSALAVIPLLRKRFSRVTFVGVSAGFFAAMYAIFAGLIFLPPKYPTRAPLYALSVVGGIADGAFETFLAIITNDVIDYDELLSGRRREAVYHALGTIPAKAIDVGLNSLPLITFGVLGIKSQFMPPDEAPAGALLAIRAWETWLPWLAMAVGAVVWRRYYKLTPAVFDAVKKEVAIMRRDRSAARYDPLTKRTFYALDIAAECAAPGDKDVAEYLRYFSRRDLLAFAGGWRKRWLWKYGLDLTAFAAFSLALIVEGLLAYTHPFGDGGLTRNQHRNLAVLMLVAGWGFAFPAAYYALQSGGVRWALRQPKATLRRYVDELARRDTVVRGALRSASAASEQGGVAAAFGGGWQRIVRHEALKLGLGAGVVVLLHCLCFQSPSAPSCHALAAFAKKYEDTCVESSLGKKSCMSLHGCTWRR